MNKKYEFTGVEQQFGKVMLKQIVALKNFSMILKGTLGGWIESEDNLSQEGESWVFKDAMVGGQARVLEDAWVSSDIRVFGDVVLKGNAHMSCKILTFNI